MYGTTSHGNNIFVRPFRDYYCATFVYLYTSERDLIDSSETKLTVRKNATNATVPKNYNRDLSLQCRIEYRPTENNRLIVQGVCCLLRKECLKSVYNITLWDKWIKVKERGTGENNDKIAITPTCLQ